MPSSKKGDLSFVLLFWIVTLLQVLIEESLQIVSGVIEAGAAILGKVVS